MFTNVKQEFFQNPMTDLLKNFPNIFFNTKIDLELEKSIVSARIKIDIILARNKNQWPKHKMWYGNILKNINYQKLQFQIQVIEFNVTGARQNNDKECIFVYVLLLIIP